MARPRRGGVVQRSRPRYLWCPASDRVNALAAATTDTSANLIATLSSDAGIVSTPGMVIERIIGMLYVRPTSAGTAVKDIDFTAGIRVLGDDGAESPPTLDTEIARWLWWYGGMVSGLVAEVASGSFVVQWDPAITFDVHGRWRLTDAGDTLQMAIVNHDAEDSLTWSLWTRTLIRIP